MFGRFRAPLTIPVSLLLPGAALVLLTAAPACADSTIRLGDDFAFKPYVLGQLDAASFRESQPGGQSAGLNVRRARLGGRLEVADQVQLGFIWDFGHQPGADGTLFEAQASYIGLKPFTATVGVFKTNFSLESMQSAGGYLMIERASIVTIARNLAAGIRRQGIQLQADGDRYNVSIAGTAGTAGPGRDGNQRAVVARAAGLPYRSEAMTVHTGLSAEWVTRPANALGDPAAFTLSDRTELQVDDVSSALSTGKIAARSGGAFGPEFGATWERLWVQAEYYTVLVNRQTAMGGGTPRFDGWYAQAAYTVLGKPRQWEHATGSWGSPKPTAGFDPRTREFGAVEIGLRYSTANLNSLDVRGGRQGVVSTIVNWWPVEPLRFSIMYEHADIQGGKSPRNIHAVGARAQLQF